MDFPVGLMRYKESRVVCNLDVGRAGCGYEGVVVCRVLDALDVRCCV